MKHLPRALSILSVVLSSIAANASADVTPSTFDDDGTPGSLRGLIIAANHGGDRVIVLESGTYKLSIAGSNEDDSATGDLDILVDMAISSALGTRAELVIIDASELRDRVLEVHDKVTLNLDRLTISGGQADGPTAGGGIRNAGVLELLACNVSGNTASDADGDRVGVEFLDGGIAMLLDQLWDARQRPRDARRKQIHALLAQLLGSLSARGQDLALGRHRYCSTACNR